MKMKNVSLILATLIALVLTGCSQYGYVSLSYPIEPEVYLPENVHSIAIVNRSLTNEETKNAKVFEAIVSTEIGSDFLASDACIKGVYDAIVQLPNTELVIPTELRMLGTGTRELPDLLSWDQVEEICQKEGADVLLVLESSCSDNLIRFQRYQQMSMTGCIRFGIWNCYG